MSEDDYIPLIRNDLQLTQYQEDNQEYIVLTDNFGYALSEVILTLEFFEFLMSLNGTVKYSELSKELSLSDSAIINILVENIKYLDSQFVLDSISFRKRRDDIENKYLSLENRPYICSGSSYPADKDKLVPFLNSLFEASEFRHYRSDARALIIPHIDLRLANESHEVYSAGYHSAYDTEFDLIVVFGTAHYVSSDLMMLTKKNYSTPLGVCQTDFELIDVWENEFGFELHFNEFAHKPEHSIEYQILLSQYYFRHKDFKVLPVLIGSFHDFIESRSLPDSSLKFDNLVKSLKNAIVKCGRKPLFISSVDFAHIGRKFGDDFDASPCLMQLEVEDKHLIDAINECDKIKFFKKITEDCDKYRICGTSPIYSMMSVADFNRADFLKYKQWNELETKSAVSFASFALYD